MICTQCRAEMLQTDKDSSSGRVIREFLCRNCGHSGWEDEGVALWQVLHDAHQQDETEAAARAHSAPASPTSQDSRPTLWLRLCSLFRRRR